MTTTPRLTMKSLLRSALIAGGLLAIGAATARFPPAGYVYDVTYYSDYSYTTRVGNERWTCDGYLHWGQRTIYKVENSWPCTIEE
jgi:hypothetical protein